ncbi:30S ribosomal protein S4 [Patescibacteria group bacterium]
MARHTDSVCKLCRREGEKLFLKGERCYSQKCSVSRRNYAPGQHGLSRRNKPSEYGTQLREKQKVKRIYGVLERQFRRYFEKANQKEGVTGDLLLQSLEQRLDNVIYRSGLASSRPLARQLIRHGHILINKKRVDIPSYAVNAGDEITIAENKTKQVVWEGLMKRMNPKNVPNWLTWDPKSQKLTIASLPTKADVEQKINMQLIVELYSR